MSGQSPSLAPARVDSLLRVLQRRVDRALAVLRHCNELVQRAEGERIEQHARLQDTLAQRLRELSRQADAISEGARRPLCGHELVAARNRLAWWSACVDERKKALAAAEASLLKSQAEAAQARLRYQTVEARQRGLARLVDQRRRAIARDRARIDECESDDRWTATTIQAGCTVESTLE